MDIEIIKSSRDELNLWDSEFIYEYILKINPQIVINAAAYNSVDKAEEDPESAYKINTYAPSIIAESVNKLKRTFIQCHILQLKNPTH